MDTRPAAHAQESVDDLSALAWVHDELRRSLDAAHKSLRRFVKETETLGSSDVDVVDPSVLRNARAQIHQGVGALELVGLPAAATVLRASEAAVQKYVSRPHKLSALVVEDIERASFALLDYLSRMLAGKTVSPLSLFPQYRAVQEAAGAERVHPADLWNEEWRWRELAEDARAAPRLADSATRGLFEALLIGIMRGTTAQAQAAAGRLSDVCAGLGAGAARIEVSTLWKLAAAVFEAQSQGLLELDVFSKRVASRLMAPLRSLEAGEFQVPERLAHDLLFFCAQSASPGDGRHAQRLAAVRQAYGLAHHVPVDYTLSVLGRYDPAWISQARKRVAAAKESWSGVAGGELHRLTGLVEQFSLVGDSLKRLFPLGDMLAAELNQAGAQAQNAGAAPSATLAMEVATSLLYIDAVLEDADFDHPEQAARVRRLVERLAAARTGRPAEPLESWMEELYRRVSDRQTLGSVVQELRASLSEVEKQIDQYFRNPADRTVLIPVPGQLSAMRGVLSVLGMEQASSALLRMRDEIDALASTEVEPEHVSQRGVFDRLAGNLGALGFLIDMLSVQPNLAKSLFHYDAQAGTLSPVMGRRSVPTRAVAHVAPVEPRLIEQAKQVAASAASSAVPVEDLSQQLDLLSQHAQAAEQGALVATVARSREAINQATDEAELHTARGELSDALADFVLTTSGPVGLDALPPATPAPAPVAAPVASAPLPAGHDDEMREVFLEEAREVLADARAALAELLNAPSELSLLTTVRRAFHTLKGSSRMVGLKEFGDAAWPCEQLYNTQLADHRAAEAPLLEFTGWVLGHLAGWIEDIAAQRDGARTASAVKTAAQRIADGLPHADAQAPSDISLPLALPPDLPSAADLDLAPAMALPEVTEVADAEELPSLPVEALAALPAAPVAAPVDEPAFELDLGAFDLPPAAAPVAEPTLDLDAAALAVPFDHQATEPMPLRGPVSEAAPLDALPSLDLDLGPPTTTEPMLQELAPSRAAPLAAEPELPRIDLSLRDLQGAEATPTVEPELSTMAEDENVKLVGPLRIGIPLFNIYLNEADELSRRLTTEVAEWAMELHRPIGETAIALAHSLAGSSATVGFSDLSQLARALEHAEERSQVIGHGTADEARLFVDVAEEIRRLLHQFAAGFLKEPAPELLARLAEHEISSARRLEAATAAAELSEPSGFGALPMPATAELMHFEPAAAEPEVVEPVREEAESPAAMAESEVADTAPIGLDGAPESTFEPAFAARDTTGFGSDTRFDPFGVAELKPLAALAVEKARHVSRETLSDEDEDIDAIDAVDAELFPIFEEEAQELLPQLAGELREWSLRPSELKLGGACMRTLHTLKGGARLAGAMRLGELAHRLETRIEHLLAAESVNATEVELLLGRGDVLSQVFEALRARDAKAYAEAQAAVVAPAPAAPAPVVAAAVKPAPLPPAVTTRPAAVAPPVAPVAIAAAQPEPAPAPEPSAAPLAAPVTQMPVAPVAAGVAEAAPIDWSRFALGGTARKVGGDKSQAGTQSAVRVRAPLLDRLVNQAGEVSITRTRIESEVGHIKGSLTDLTENLDRLRQQLRDIEFQAETQMSSRMEAAKAASQNFDPLEFDRFTRFQELTRMMAESVNDVATVQRTLQRALDSAEDELAAQARLTRDLQDDLLRTRMVEFEGLSDRLYRVVRQAAKETGKQVRLDIIGGSIEVDRGVLDRMTAAFEHLLRNCVTHGVEMPATRSQARKDPTGSIVVSLSQEGNEVGVEFRDDGAGLDLPRIRSKAIAVGLLDAAAQPTEAELANLIFTPGFSTADAVTELAGRGIGMDVVRSEVTAMGGRVETATAPGQGTAFKLILPLTTAVTQVVMLRCAETTVAVPSTLVEIVRRATPAEIDQAYASGIYPFGDRTLPFFWLGALLQISPRSLEPAARTRSVVVIRSAQQRIAIHVDQVLGNQEAVVKNLGPQLSRLPGLAGMTLLASGAVALIYNPVALATLYGESARAATFASLRAPDLALPLGPAHAEPVVLAPLVLVVDDSLTVRRVTQRLLVREGYRVALAKDGLDALERLAEERPAIVLSDIEMPRMDGFDLVRNMRADARLRDLPVIMITSRIAQKHRDYAAQLGVDHYLGKPYSEEDLLALVGRYAALSAVA